jgi:hypothetical protein
METSKFMIAIFLETEAITFKGKYDLKRTMPLNIL